MMLQSSISGSIEAGKSGLCMSIPKLCEIKSFSLPKTCSTQVLGIGDGLGGGGDGDGGNIQSCKLCGHSEIISNMVLCDCCEEAFHVPCCKLSVVLPIDEWFCHSCLKMICKLSQNVSFLKEPSISSRIGSCKLEMVPTAVLGIEDSLGGAIQSCKLCGHAENISNMLLCDGCEDAFHIPCCKLSVLPIDEWFCQSCLKEFHILSQNGSSLKPSSISLGIGWSKFELGTDDMQSCKLCGHSEHISNRLLCDQCEEAFHVTCCKPRVRFPIDEWLCHSCSKISDETAKNNSLLQSPSSSCMLLKSLHYGIVGTCMLHYDRIIVVRICIRELGLE